MVVFILLTKICYRQIIKFSFLCSHDTRNQEDYLLMKDDFVKILS